MPRDGGLLRRWLGRFGPGGTRSCGPTPAETPPRPPPLPHPAHIRIHPDGPSLAFIDLQPIQAPTTAAQSRTLVLLHGAPGTYRDYRYLIPALQTAAPDARLVGLNFPGFGGSAADDGAGAEDCDDTKRRRFLEHTHAIRAAECVRETAGRLCAEDPNVFLIGHSFGGHAAMTIAAQNLLAAHDHRSPSSSLSIRGIVLLAAAGYRPHRILRPRTSALVVELLRSSPPAIATGLLPRLLKAFYTTVLGFPDDFPPCHYVAGVVRAGTTDFATVVEHVNCLQTAAMPTFHAWSGNDEFMEPAIPTELASALAGGRRLEFAGAGHNLQKTRAEPLAQEIAAWTAEVLERGHSPSPSFEHRP